MITPRSVFRFFNPPCSVDKKTVLGIGLSAALAVAALSLVVQSPSLLRRAEAPQDSEVREGVPPALAKKMARWAKFSPGIGDPERDNRLDNPGSWADQDWFEHS